MKEKTIEEKVEKIVYEAIDGTIFECEDECRQYDMTCRAIVRARFFSFSKSIENYSVAGSALSAVLHPDGCDSSLDFYISTPKNAEDCAAIAQFIRLEGDDTDICFGGPSDAYAALHFNELKPGNTYIVEIEEEWGSVYSEEKLSAYFQRKVTNAFHGDIKFWKEEEKEVSK